MCLKTRLQKPMIAGILVTACMAAGLVSAQSATPAPAPQAPKPAPAKPAWPPEGPTPRTADGKPDLSGNWQPNAIRENVDLVGTLKGQGIEVPMLPWAAELHQKRKDSLSKDDPEARCLPPGVPRMSTTPYPWTMIQTPQLIVIVYEGGAHIWRKIFMDTRDYMILRSSTRGWETRSDIGKATRWWSKPSGRTISRGSTKAELRTRQI